MGGYELVGNFLHGDVDSGTLRNNEGVEIMKLGGNEKAEMVTLRLRIVETFQCYGKEGYKLW
jgi:hypothetical protein